MRIKLGLGGFFVAGLLTVTSATHVSAQGKEQTAKAGGEASGQTVTLTCGGGQVISVRAASYGPNCKPELAGNQTATLAGACDGKETCPYKVDHTVIGDPAYGCRKDYVATYSCGAPPPKAIGCFKDQGDPGGTKGRDLDGHMLGAPDMTAAKCRAACTAKGFQFAGTQYGSQCFCGDTYGKTGPANNCNAPCAGNPKEMCGGTWANLVYKTDAPPKAAANPCKDIPGPGCFWMEAQAPYCWVKSPAPAPDRGACMRLDSCSPEGGKASGGGCYKWAKSANGPMIDAQGCEVISGEGCYWMEAKAPNCWVKSPSPVPNRAACMRLDSCSPEGGKASGGGCYKWADASNGPLKK